MKLSLFLIIIPFLLYVFTGCGNNTSISKEEIIQTPTSTVSETERLIPENFFTDNENVSDDDLLYFFINGFEICLTSAYYQFLFDDPDEIEPERLFVFFLYSLTDVFFREDYSVYEERWLKDDGLFHIPVKDITDRLSRYFEHFDFDTAKLRQYSNEYGKVSYGYDAAEDVYITGGLSGFGGDAYTKLVRRTYKDGIMEADINIYDDYEETKLIMVKRYRIRFYETGYYLLSIKHVS